MTWDKYSLSNILSTLFSLSWFFNVEAERAESSNKVCKVYKYLMICHGILKLMDV